MFSHPVIQFNNQVVGSLIGAKLEVDNPVNPKLLNMGQPPGLQVLSTLWRKWLETFSCITTNISKYTKFTRTRSLREIFIYFKYLTFIAKPEGIMFLGHSKSVE